MYKIFIPKSKTLQKYIHNFYVMEKFDGEVSYMAFPQLGMTMAFFINTDLRIEENFLTISSSEKPEPKILLLGKYKLPIKFKYLNFVPEISINFTPTGLNYFFKDNTCDIANNYTQLILAEDWKKVTNQIFDQDTDDKKMVVLENFLLDNLVEKNLSIVENYISVLNEHPEFTIQDIAEQLSVSTKTINRCFAKYIGCSPMDFKQICRFRRAIHIRFNKPLEKLTQICFDSNFYDAPHFTREVKKLTHMNPRDFFSEVEPAAEKDIPYKFL